MVAREQTTVVHAIHPPVTDLTVIKRRQHDKVFGGARRGAASQALLSMSDGLPT